MLKKIALLFFVFLYVPARDLYRRLRGRAHVTVLVYHRVNDSFHDPMTVGVDQFRRQLAQIARSYDVLDFAQFLAQRGKPRYRPAVVITFDDGYADNHDAAKILKAASLPATFFISTGIVGGNSGFPHDRFFGYAPNTLTWAQVRSMAEWGFNIGNHTEFHPDLAAISHDAAHASIRAAASELNRKLPKGARGDWLAYPFGKPESITAALLAELPSHGISSCLSAYGGTNPPEFDPLNVVRQGVDWRTSHLSFRATLAGWNRRRPRAENAQLANQTAHSIYFEPLAHEALQERRERNFFGNLRQQNGTYKFTYGNRLDELNELIGRWLPARGKIDAMDVGASSGASGLAWSRSLTALGFPHSLTLGDLRLHCHLVTIARRFRVLVDSTGYALQFDLAGRAVSNPPSKSKWAWAWPLFAALRCIARRVMKTRLSRGPSRLYNGRFFGLPVSSVPITLVSPRILAEPHIRVVEDDVTMWEPSFARRFDVVRAANLLNRDYFDESTIIRIVNNLRGRLKPGGILAICSTENDINSGRGGFADVASPTNHGTVFILRGDDLEVAARLGRGSAVEDAVVRTNSRFSVARSLEGATS